MLCLLQSTAFPCPVPFIFFTDMYNNIVTGFQKCSLSHIQVHLVIREFKEHGLILMQSTNLDRFQLLQGRVSK